MRRAKSPPMGAPEQSTDQPLGSHVAQRGRSTGAGKGPTC